MSRPRLSRRRVLALATGVVSGLAGCGSRAATESYTDSETEVPTETTRTTRPERTPTETRTPTTTTERGTDETVQTQSDAVDAVADLGCDPSGEQSCTEPLAGGLSRETVVQFPPGTYRFGEPLSILKPDRVAFRGQGDVSFVPPEGFNDWLFNVDGVGSFELTGIDLDLTAPATTAGLRLICEESLTVRDVTYRGRGSHPSGRVRNAMNVAVRNPEGQAVVENLAIRRGSVFGNYKNGDGRVGIWAGRAHRGTLRVKNCHLAEFGNNAMYTSRNPGRVQVVDSTFLNNNVSSIRIGGEGSYAMGCRIEIDRQKYDGPRRRIHDTFNPRAIVVEQGADRKPAGAAIRNCVVQLRRFPRSQGAILVWRSGKSVTITDTDVVVDVDRAPALRALPPGRSTRAETPIELHRTNVRGQSQGEGAIEVYERPGPRLVDVTVEQTANEWRQGIKLVDAPDCIIQDSFVRAGRFPAIVDQDRPASADCLLEVGLGSELVSAKMTAPCEELVDVRSNRTASDRGSRVCVGSDLAPGQGARLAVLGFDGRHLRGGPVSTESPSGDCR